MDRSAWSRPAEDVFPAPSARARTVTPFAEFRCQQLVDVLRRGEFDLQGRRGRDAKAGNTALVGVRSGSGGGSMCGRASKTGCAIASIFKFLDR